MKKIISIILLMAMCVSLLTACNGETKNVTDGNVKDVGNTETGSNPVESSETKKVPVAGAIWYNFGDTFIAKARTTLNEAAAADGAIKVVDADSQNDIGTQTSNLNNFYTQGVDYIVLNNINTNAISEIVSQAKDKNTTIIFANTNSPTEEDFASFDKVYHVSSVATQSGTIIGEHLAKYWKEHPEADRNGNGKLDYVMFLGLQGHYDTTVRSEYSVKAIQDAGIQTNLIQETIANYQRSDAQNQMASILQARKDDVEAVIACNDDMALGAIEALKASGFFKDESTYIPVVGVDATQLGVDAINEGTLLGTALNNPVILGNSIYKLMSLLNEGKELTQENLGMSGVNVEGHHININYVGITKDNVQDAKY